jgi:hypothetical protein
MLGDIKDRSRARQPALIRMGSATVPGRHVPRLAEHLRFCIRVCPWPSVVKKHDFAKRTHFEKFLNPCKSIRNTKAARHFGAKTNPISIGILGGRAHVPGFSRLRLFKTF